MLLRDAPVDLFLEWRFASVVSDHRTYLPKERPHKGRNDRGAPRCPYPAGTSTVSAGVIFHGILILCAGIMIITKLFEWFSKSELQTQDRTYIALFELAHGIDLIIYVTPHALEVFLILVGAYYRNQLLAGGPLSSPWLAAYSLSQTFVHMVCWLNQQRFKPQDELLCGALVIAVHGLLTTGAIIVATSAISRMVTGAIGSGVRIGQVAAEEAAEATGEARAMGAEVATLAASVLTIMTGFV
ncbi:hypothetical protein RQP46_011110 [Phenoliferia psychrophenolica]